MIADLKLALISDKITREALAPECRIYDITPINYRAVLRLWKPDLLLVESSWLGWRNRWRYKIAAYPEHPDRSNLALLRVVEAAKKRGVPTVFWNKEDCVHFERFIDSARHFDHILTVDDNCRERYRQFTNPSASVHTFMFAVQPKYHNFTGFNFKDKRANFVGSYSRFIHPRRRAWQDMLFSVAAEKLGLLIVDRNSGRKANIFRYPDIAKADIRPAVAHRNTAEIYRRHLVSLNINTVEDSPSMFSRRLIEILACGGLAVTTPSKAVSLLFADYCHIVESLEGAKDLFSRLAQDGPSKDDLDRAQAGATLIASKFTWGKWLMRLAELTLNR